jgi:hypothetical protein
MIKMRNNLKEKEVKFDKVQERKIEKDKREQKIKFIKNK